MGRKEIDVKKGYALTSRALEVNKLVILVFLNIIDRRYKDFKEIVFFSHKGTTPTIIFSAYL